MARFCANCGAQLDDSSKFCGVCGTPTDVSGMNMDETVEEVTVAEEASAVTEEIAAIEAPAQEDAVVAQTEEVNAQVETEASQAQAEAPQAEAPQAEAPQTDAPAGSQTDVLSNILNSGMIKWIACGLAALIVIIVAVVLISSNMGYKGTLNKMCKALVNYDIDTLEDLASSVNEEMVEDYYGRNKDPYDVYEDRVSDTLDRFEDKVGEVKKITYVVTDFNEFSDRRLRAIEEELEDEYNMDTSKFKKIAEVELKLTVKGKKKSATYNVRDLYMIKEGGKWKLLYGKLR